MKPKAALSLSLALLTALSSLCACGGAGSQGGGPEGDVPSGGAAQTEESVGSTLNNIKISGTPAAFAGQKATDHPPRGEASYNTVDGIAYSLWAT